MPKPGPYLTAAQKRQFRRIVGELKDGNLLDAADGGMVELAAIGLDVVAQCNAHLSESLTVEVVRVARDKSTRIETVPSPYLRMRAVALNELRYLYRELGIGPAARAALGNAHAIGRKPAQTLPGVGAKPTPLRAVGVDEAEG